MSLYQIRARQGPHIKTYLISWQLFGPKISLEIHCWPITTFFKTVGENFSQCQIVLFCMMVSNCPILHNGVKLSQVSNCPRCQIVLFAFMVSNCPTCHYGVKLSEVSNGPRCQIVRGVKWSQDHCVLIEKIFLDFLIFIPFFSQNRTLNCMIVTRKVDAKHHKQSNTICLS